MLTVPRPAVARTSTVPAAPLLTIHPGTPGHYRVRVDSLKLIRETDKAVLFERVASGRQAWFPKSAVRFTPPLFPAFDTLSASVAAWFYLKVCGSL